ncbi:unnamed protein product [Pleuronectes platessa]|uniref:Calponin-homology (CH) domain-containing protein n=1 Tax=Pleuronectes platessa TaxID=8262 RepID=A0A9N7VTG4_PLEPL|nr:unnamed protein product [Pleuronectes platessa]
MATHKDRRRDQTPQEENYGERSSGAPCPGDTLPWNLSKHQRVRRSKSASGDVLDPAERAVIRIADERDRVQKKTFTKWVNKHLIKHRRGPESQHHVTDLYEDLRDGHNLISLLEVLSGDTLPREKGRMRFHKLQNVQIALDFLRHRQVKLVNIRNDDIADGNPKLTLGLIWTIILHFQVSIAVSAVFHYIIAFPLFGETAPVTCHFISWEQSQWTPLFKIPLMKDIF